MKLSATAATRIEEVSRLLRSGKAQRVTLAPLVLKETLRNLLARRARLFTEWQAQREGHGHVVSFKRHLRPTPHTPEGRVVTGQFEILEGGKELCVLASILGSDEESHGPRLLARRAYPLGVRPFVKSEDLLRRVINLAKAREWFPICVDAIGYDRETHEFRRDMKHQSIADAFREMEDQGRLVHQVKVSFRAEGGHARLLATLNRYGRAVVEHGEVSLVAKEFVVASAEDWARGGRELSVVREATRSRQKVVRLVFPRSTLVGPEEIAALCDALRRGHGLNVTTVHLNPYLNAQVLDYLTGDAVQLVVMDDASVSLLPRSVRSRGTVERVVATIFRFFGEAEVRVEPIGKSNWRGGSAD